MSHGKGDLWPLDDVVDFEQSIFSLSHAAAAICRLSPAIMRFDIEAKAAYIAPLFGKLFHMFVKSMEDAAAPERWDCINTLNPPKDAVTPIRPFIRDQHLSSGSFIDFSNEIETVSWVRDNGADPIAQAEPVQRDVLRFKRHVGVPVYEEVYVVGGRGADDNLTRASHPPNLSAARALAFAASSSRFLGGAVVSKERRRRDEMSAISWIAA